MPRRFSAVLASNIVTQDDSGGSSDDTNFSEDDLDVGHSESEYTESKFDEDDEPPANKIDEEGLEDEVPLEEVEPMEGEVHLEKFIPLEKEEHMEEEAPAVEHSEQPPKRLKTTDKPNEVANFPFNEQPGLKIAMERKQKLDFFKHFFTEEFLNLMVVETNQQICRSRDRQTAKKRDDFHYLMPLPTTEKKKKTRKPCVVCIRQKKRKDTRFYCECCMMKPALYLGLCLKNYHV